jgi:hypothetical protein
VPAPNERIGTLCRRLEASREEVFALAHVLKGDARELELAAVSEELHAGFSPQSRLMRALLGRPGRVLLAGGAVALTLLRPRLLSGAMRLLPLMRPLLLRYLLPRLLGQQ